MNRYFVLRANSDPIEWTPPEPSESSGLDMTYWGRVLAAMERSLERDDLTVYLAWSIGTLASLPTVGRNVVVIGVVGEAFPRLPWWSHRVRAVFKAGGPRPELGSWSPSPPVPALTALAVWARGWRREFPGAAAAIAARARDGGRPCPRYLVPLGYHGRVELPVKPIRDRSTAVSFAGSVKHWEGWWGAFTVAMGAPKVRSRRQMLRALARLQATHPELRIETRISSSFADWSPTTGSYDLTEDRSYCDLLSNTKICLAPRGAYLETFRHFEALRAGCVVVTDAWPDRWYLGDAPFILVRSWNELPNVVLPLLRDPAELDRLHRASLEHWRTRCSEEAVGRFIADRLNALGSHRLGDLPLERSRVMAEV